MSDKGLRAFFRLGVFIGFAGLAMVFCQPPNSAEFVASLCSAVIGFTIIALALLLNRLDWGGWLDRMAARRQAPGPFDETPYAADDEAEI